MILPVLHLIITIAAEENFESQVRAASLVVLLYDLTVEKAKNRVDSFWLPKISSINNKIPVIIAGNKKDLVKKEVNLKEFIDPLVRQYSQIDTGIIISTKYHEDMADFLYCAQRAVLYPIYPLFNQSMKELRPKYVSALERIFRMCDSNHDKYLDDEELKSMQEIALSGTLTNDDINSLKELLIGEVHFLLNKSSASIIEKKKRRKD